MNAEDHERAMDGLFASLPSTQWVVRANNEAENKRRAERMDSDILPACPRCGDKCPVGSRWCADCGTRLQ